MLVQEVFAILKNPRDNGVTILLIEQNARQAQNIGLWARAGAGPDAHREHGAQHLGR